MNLKSWTPINDEIPNGHLLVLSDKSQTFYVFACSEDVNRWKSDNSILVRAQNICMDITIQMDKVCKYSIII